MSLTMVDLTVTLASWEFTPTVAASLPSIKIPSTITFSSLISKAVPEDTDNR